MSKTLQISLFITLCFASLNCYAESQLLEVSRTDSRNKTLLFFTFDKLPRYTDKITGKRVDISFEKTFIPKTLEFFKTDDRIVKILPPSNTNKDTFTFFLRYHPQKITAERKGNILVFNILPGNTFTKAYTEVSEQFTGVTIVDRKTADFSNPNVASPYTHNWKTFFLNYEAPLNIQVGVKFTLPSFPITDLFLVLEQTDTPLLSDETLLLADEELWGVLLNEVQKQLSLELDPERKKALALIYGEALFRNGNFTGAFKQLYLLSTKYSDEQLGIFAKYLLCILQATYEDPYIGSVELNNLAPKIHPKSKLSPYYLLSQIELSLATDNLDLMESHLSNDNVGFPMPIDKVKELRQADYLFSTNQSIQAYVSYKLIKDIDLIAEYPYSLNGYCSTLYTQKQYETASECYEKLLDHIKDKEMLGMVSFRKAMSDLKYKSPTSVINDFSRIEDAFPGTDAGFKAALKKVDILTTSQDNWDDYSGRYYKALADKAVTKDTSEEASLKEAINFRLIGLNSKSVELTQTFLRNYRSGKLTSTGEALLIDMLPDEINRLVEDKEYMKVLVLAKQNKRFFSNNWIDIRLLSELAVSYNEIGIYKEAQRLYEYLIEILDEDSRAPYFLPLIQTIFKQGDFDLVEDVATQYFYDNPNGKDVNEITLILMKSLFADKKYDKAKSLIQKPLPDNVQYKTFVGSLYYHTEEPKKSVETLEPLWVSGNLNKPIDQFVLADSLYMVEEYQKAKPIFLRLKIDNPKDQQTLYRLSKIENKLDNKEESLKYLQELVETDGDSLWKKAALKELEYEDFANEFSDFRKSL